MKTKASYVGVPPIFKLELACKHLGKAFDGIGIYHVGSSLERLDWRDVDVVMIMSDEAFRKEFPSEGCHFEFNTKWLLLTIWASEWLSEQSGLPVDFKFQPATWANETHQGPRNAMDMGR